MDKNEELRKILAGRKAKTTTQNSNLDKENSNSNLNSRLNNQNSNLNNNINLNSKNVNKTNQDIKNQAEDKTTSSIFKSNELTKSGRDYNKEPLILKDYTIAMIIHDILNIFLWFVLFFVIIGNTNNYENHISIFGLILFYSIIFFIDIFLFCIITKSNRIIMLYNSVALFYKDNKLIRKFNMIADNNIEFNSFFHLIKSYYFIMLPIALISIMIAITENDNKIYILLSKVIFSLVLAILYDILFRAIIYKKSNKTFDNFIKYSLKLKIDIGWIRGHRSIDRKGISIFFFNKKDYMEIKKYLYVVFGKNLDTNKQ
ncbi:putative membrane protein [Campylobacter blaseri]|uniref:Uncharacterized protein n=1 Tax=Campylobacter blaseri TaxID=2042961 RepID=A0A2P8R232_9BACT|nr:hypothetical protein [Campylobacter blaseri]PSM52538.1 hypothetical protein CQ405_02085 [Campylobacter blaseri]PSM54186.1 hypothetical protein CRN67_02085 [Campylobacter blaseri]QKF85837.1 putative membrane protein [Campylobacter blaseri]